LRFFKIYTELQSKRNIGIIFSWIRIIFENLNSSFCVSSRLWLFFGKLLISWNIYKRENFWWNLERVAHDRNLKSRKFFWFSYFHFRFLWWFLRNMGVGVNMGQISKTLQNRYNSSFWNLCTFFAFFFCEFFFGLRLVTGSSTGSSKSKFAIFLLLGVNF